MEVSLCMIKTKVNLESNRDFHMQLTEHWTFLAKIADSHLKMIERIGEANKHAKLALDIQAEINNWK
jgi:hypothetical protein